MKKKYLFILIAILLVGSMLAACTTPEATEAPADEADSGETVDEAEDAGGENDADEDTEASADAVPPAERTYFEVLALTNLPYFIDHRVGLEFAGYALGTETRYVGPVEYDMTAMVNTLEQAVAEQPDGINVVGFDDALKPAIDSALEAGVPVVTLDADVPSSNRPTFLGTGNYSAGRVGAQLLAEAIGGEGKVVLLTKTGQSNLEERIRGYEEEFAENWPDIEVVQIVNTDSDSAKAADGLKAVIQREPDLAGVGCVEAAGGVGAATAIKELDMVGDVQIISMDRDDGTLQFIEEGVIYASVAQQSALMTFWGTLLMDGYMHNPVPIVSDNEAANITPLPSYVDTGTVIINQENASHFYHVPDPYDFSSIEVTGPADGETYVEVLALTNLPYFIDHRLGLEFAGEELGVETKFIGPVEYDMTAMVNTLEQTIAEEPAGILVIGFDDALAPAINAAVEAGIPVVTLDADVANSDRLAFLGTGNYNAGRTGAQLLAESIGGEGQVALLTKTGQSNLEERIRGYEEEFAENWPDIEVVQIVNTDSDSAKAADGLKAVIQRYPDLAGVGCVEAAGGVGAATAVKELDMVGDVHIVSMDRDDGTLQFIEEGVIDYSVAQKTALMSYLGTKMLYYLNHAPVPVVPDNEAANITPVPSYIDTGVIVIDADNAHFFYHE